MDADATRLRARFFNKVRNLVIRDERVLPLHRESPTSDFRNRADLRLQVALLIATLLYKLAVLVGYPGMPPRLQVGRRLRINLVLRRHRQCRLRCTQLVPQIGDFSITVRFFGKTAAALPSRPPLCSPSTEYQTRRERSGLGSAHLVTHGTVDIHPAERSEPPS